jgi:glycosyltransferase involved in cell wall biosynthesis
MTPVFSIVVPTCDRPGPLAACLTSLARLDYPRDAFEVVVVDDGSTPPIEALSSSLAAHCALSLIRQHRKGPAAARNLGAARARGKLLAFTDDDCVVDAGWLRAFEARLAGAPDCLAGGRTRNGLPRNSCATASQAVLDYLYARYNTDPERVRFFASNNLAVGAERFSRAGGFDESFRLPAGEDRELSERWLDEGGRLGYVPDALVTHHHDLTLAGFARQQFNYGRGARRLSEVRAGRSRPQPHGEPLRFYLDLVRHVARAAGRPSPRLAALALLSQAAIAAGFARGSRSSRGDRL